MAQGDQMRTRTTSRNKPSRTEPALVATDPGISQSRPIDLPNRPTGDVQHRSFVPSTQNPPALRNEAAEVLADIDGIPVLVRFLLADVPAHVRSDFVSGDVDLHALLLTTVEKAIDRMGGSSLRRDDRSKQALATVELISSAEHLARLPVLSNDTVLRVGPLELDLLDRTAKRSHRRIDLRPREFQLLKYLMQRSERLLTRATLLKDVWNYKFVPEGNLVDVHMSNLRRKVDAPNEPPLIRNVRGVGFVLSASPLSECPMPRPAEQAAA
jgi:DNA-binding winged helix-turn-helix (wHTH) protein